MVMKKNTAIGREIPMAAYARPVRRPRLSSMRTTAVRPGKIARNEEKNRASVSTDEEGLNLGPLAHTMRTMPDMAKTHEATASLLTLMSSSSAVSEVWGSSVPQAEHMLASGLSSRLHFGHFIFLLLWVARDALDYALL